MQKLIGLSLSKCCRDIANGTVAYRDVKVIIAGTSIRNLKAKRYVLQLYRECYWREPECDPWKATRIFRKFFAEGKVDMVVWGGRPRRSASTVVDLSGPAPVILRQGPIRQEDIRRVAA